MRDLRLAFIINKETKEPDVSGLIDYLHTTGIESTKVLFLKSDIDISIKYFHSGLFGLDNIKDKLRDSNVLNGIQADIIYFVYNPLNYQGMANWTYPNDLYGASFCEIPVHDSFIDTQYLEDALIHETGHALIRSLWRKGVVLEDTLDSVGRKQEELIEENYNRIKQHYDILLMNDSPLELLLKKLKELLTKLLQEYRIKVFAKAVQRMEGWYEGSLAYRNNNPGNIRYTQFTKEYLNAQEGENGFSKWDTYEEGFEALIKFLKMAFTGELRSYDPDMTLIEFFQVYAPSSDNNRPVQYAEFVANQLKVAPQTKLKEIYV